VQKETLKILSEQIFQGRSWENLKKGIPPKECELMVLTLPRADDKLLVVLKAMPYWYVRHLQVLGVCVRSKKLEKRKQDNLVLFMSSLRAQGDGFETVYPNINVLKKDFIQ